MTTFRDRIKDLRRVRAGDLRPHPRNWRTHPEAQRSALAAVLAEVGWADALIVREKDGALELVDGHLRADLDPEAQVPVLVVDLDDDEADKVLLTLDPLAAMAVPNMSALQPLAEQVQLPEAARSMIEKLLTIGGKDWADSFEASPGAVNPNDGFVAITFFVPSNLKADMEAAIETAGGKEQFIVRAIHEALPATS